MYDACFYPSPLSVLPPLFHLLFFFSFTQPAISRKVPPYDPSPAHGFLLLKGSFPKPLFFFEGADLLGHSLGCSNVTYHSKLPGSRIVIVKEHIVPHIQLLVALFKSSDITFAASFLKKPCPQRFTGQFVFSSAFLVIAEL